MAVRENAPKQRGAFVCILVFFMDKFYASLFDTKKGRDGEKKDPPKLQIRLAVKKNATRGLKRGAEGLQHGARLQRGKSNGQT